MKNWQWLIKDKPARLGILPYLELSNCDKQHTSHISSKWNTRVYPDTISPPLIIHSRPMISRISSPVTMEVNLSVSVISGDVSDIQFPVFLVQPDESDKSTPPFVSLLQEPLEVIQELYPDAIQIAPLLGIANTTGNKLVLTDQLPDEARLGLAYSRFISARKEVDVFAPDALAKAEELLRKVAAHHGFNVTKHDVTRGKICISRWDCAFTIRGGFRCLTSDFNTPRDDQVAQKILAISNTESLGMINTLSDKDRTLILIELENVSQ